MAERFWIAPYSLMPLARLGSRASASERFGSLIRIEENGVSGYADLHPWPELGDATLAEELKSLKSPRPLRLAQRALYFARRDREARRENKSLFEGLSIPLSHRLISDLASVTAADFAKWKSEGFTHLKIKVGRDPLEELRKLKDLEVALSGFRVRFDFNEMGTVEAVSEWIRALEPRVRASIEFLEDPIVYHPTNWVRVSRETHLPLAIDRQSTPDTSSDWLVIKPAAQSATSFTSSRAKLCVTSSLDHPLGQMAAALEAAELSRDREVGVCGLVSHTAYEPNDFSRALDTEGPTLKPFQDEAGLGFTELLETTDWRELEA